jgi:hypothetical protein
MATLFLDSRKARRLVVLGSLLLVVWAVSGFTLAQMVEPVNVIVNGDFEQPWEGDENHEGVSPGWLPYSNGQAHFGWYRETWPEAVFDGGQAQLMEIFEVEPNVQSRVIAIHQTVDVVPESVYELEFFAIMRSQVQESDRNKNEFEMHWGVDYSGEGDYDNVTEWNFIPLEEQFRLGSTGVYPEDKPLFYEVVTGTVETEDSASLTLFIRGMKKFATGAEVNFDVDNVSLIGPPPAGDAPDTEEPAPVDSSMPETGNTILGEFSRGPVVLGGIVLVIIGAGAAVSLVQSRRREAL